MCSPLQPDSLVPLNKHIESEPVATGDYEKLSRVSSWQSWYIREECESLGVRPLGCGCSVLQRTLWGEGRVPAGGRRMSTVRPQSLLRGCHMDTMLCQCQQLCHCRGDWWVTCLSCQVVQICRGWRSAGGSAVLRGRLARGWRWLRARCLCTADTVEYLELCCRRNQGREMDAHPQESFLKQNKRVWTKQTFLLQDSFCRLQPRLFSEELLYPPHLQAACLGSHWHSAFLL